MTGWLTSSDVDLASFWPGSIDLDPDALDAYLAAARKQCEDFAPPLEVGAPVPHEYRLAQALQARALARSGIVGSGDQLGGYGETVSVFPMDWTVKRLLRPQTRPVVA